MNRGSWHCTGDRNQEHLQEKEMQKSKMAVWGGLTNSCEKKWKPKEKRKDIPIWMHSSKEQQGEHQKAVRRYQCKEMLLLLLSHFSHVRICVTPQTAAHQDPPSLGFSTQEHWSGLPFPSPMHESEKWKGSRSVVSDSSRPHGLQPTRLLHPWDFPGKSTGVGCHCLLQTLC